MLCTAFNLKIDALDGGDHTVDANIDFAFDHHPWLVERLVADDLHKTVLILTIWVVEEHSASESI